ncbi:MAG: acetylglutamate kinase, partial [Oscillospiraceae bacterium]
MCEISNSMRSKVLIDALPYIQKYSNKVVVIKYGGNAMTNNELKQAVMSDIVLLSLVGIKVVLVHGGGPEINEMLKKVGIESKFIGGLRYTDEDTIDIVKMVLAGKVNKELVALLAEHQGKALGLCGIDGG